MLKEVFVVLCLMLALVAAYPNEDIKNDQPVESDLENLEGAESKYGGFYGSRGFGYLGGLGHVFNGRGFGFGGHGFRGFGGHGFRYWG